jgi:soluble cytochrome b562
MSQTLKMLLLVAVLGCTTSAHAHEGHGAEYHDEQVQQLMKKMQRAHRTALRSDNIEQLEPAIAQMIALTRECLTLHYGLNADEHTDYQNGMRQLRVDLEQIQLALAANDFALAKNILNQKVKATRRQSHDKFGVDEN